MRTFAALATLSLALSGLAASPVDARSGGAYYQAELASPAEDTQIIARKTLWRCAETRCVAPKSRSRDMVACKQFAKAAGEVVRFAAGGAELDAAAIAECNS